VRLAVHGKDNQPRAPAGPRHSRDSGALDRRLFHRHRQLRRLRKDGVPVGDDSRLGGVRSSSERRVDMRQRKCEGNQADNSSKETTANPPPRRAHYQNAMEPAIWKNAASAKMARLNVIRRATRVDSFCSLVGLTSRLTRYWAAIVPKLFPNNPRTSLFLSAVRAKLGRSIAHASDLDLTRGRSGISGSRIGRIRSK
jgi:hypothetical protein